LQGGEVGREASECSLANGEFWIEGHGGDGGEEFEGDVGGGEEGLVVAMLQGGEGGAARGCEGVFEGAAKGLEEDLLANGGGELASNFA
jgi:hypothetical protein